MDYTGHGRRVGSRLTFRSTWSNNSEKSLNLFLKSSRAIVDTELGPSDASEDGPYHCKKPTLALEPSEDPESDEKREAIETLASAENLQPTEDREPVEAPEPTENLVSAENLKPTENLATAEDPEPTENLAAAENPEPAENFENLELTENFSHCIKASPIQVRLAILAQNRLMVASIQRRLFQHGLNPGPIDGILGPRTTTALQAWHAARGEESSDTLRRDMLCLLLHGLPQL